MKTIFAPRLRHDKPWLATWLQERRRKRLAAAVPSGSLGLEDGLLQFYRPIEGELYVASFDETIVLGDTPYSGMAGVELLDGSGSYPANTEIRYFLLPYRLIDGGRIYHGLTTYFMTATTQDDDAVAMQEWSETPTGVDGFTVVRWVNTASLSYRHYTTAQMAAGWTDTGNGWTAGLPWNFASPMVTAKVMWSRFNHWLPQAMVTTASPLGGVAFDSGRITMHGARRRRRPPSMRTTP